MIYTTIRYSLFLVCTYALCTAFSYPSHSGKLGGETIPSVRNFHRVDDSVFRSAQPNTRAMVELERMGIKTVVNLRHVRNDNFETRKTSMRLEHVSIDTWKISYQDIVRALRAIDKAKKPVLVHCLHGSDRTGCVIAAYRMASCGWTKEQAIREMTDEEFGFHGKMFNNIVTLLESIDVETLKKDMSH